MNLKRYIFIGIVFFYFVFPFSNAVSKEKAGLRLKAFDALFGQNASFVGSGSCFSCHQEEFGEWEGTPHSTAFISLAKRGKDDDSKCLPCHTLGFGFETGFKNLEETPLLINVQCESCHGPGSLHAGTRMDVHFSEKVCLECHDLESVKEKSLNCNECHTDFSGHLDSIQKKKTILRNPPQDICIECHDEENDRRFDFNIGLKAVYHSSSYNKISRELIKEKKNVVLLKSTPKSKVSFYAGDEACRDCHKKEYDSWSKTRHATSFETLKKENEHETTRCLRCHATGYGKASGFIDEKETPFLREVGCESCHGPGKDHIDAPPDKKISSLSGITKDCPVCGMPRTCKRCHTTREDPDFSIDVDLELVKHSKSD